MSWALNVSYWLKNVCVRLISATDDRPPGVWDSFHVTDGRLVTGTNPASAKETAEAAVEAFDKL
jgi:hypothetical protein